MSIGIGTASWTHKTLIKKAFRLLTGHQTERKFF